jgi:hypothetical protein
VRGARGLALGNGIDNVHPRPEQRSRDAPPVLDASSESRTANPSWISVIGRLRAASRGLCEIVDRVAK